MTQVNLDTFRTSPRFFADGEARAEDRFGLGSGFGGCFAPETLMANLVQLESLWLDSREDAEFRGELD
ncbi:MAG: hypothetical protein AAGB93_24305, partial [Planctomycetota bacterium]